MLQLQLTRKREIISTHLNLFSLEIRSITANIFIIEESIKNYSSIPIYVPFIYFDNVVNQ